MGKVTRIAIVTAILLSPIGIPTPAQQPSYRDWARGAIEMLKKEAGEWEKRYAKQMEAAEKVRNKYASDPLSMRSARKRAYATVAVMERLGAVTRQQDQSRLDILNSIANGRFNEWEGRMLLLMVDLVNSSQRQTIEIARLENELGAAIESLELTVQASR